MHPRPAAPIITSALANVALLSCDLRYRPFRCRDKTASQWFLARKRVEGWLHVLFPKTWIPQYSMVAFTRIPYHEVIKRAEKQDRVLDFALSGIIAAAVGGAALATHKYLNGSGNGFQLPSGLRLRDSWGDLLRSVGVAK